MKKNDAIKLIDERIDELKTTIAELKTSTAISKSTRGTQLYARGKERRVLELIRELCSQLDTVKLSESTMNTFTLITTLSTERVKRATVEVNEGDLVITLLKKYENVKNVYNKIMSAAEKNGLTLSADGKFVK